MGIKVINQLCEDVVNAIAFNETDRYVYGFNKNQLALVLFDRQFKATLLPFTNPCSITGSTVYFAQASPTNSNDGARCANAPVTSTNNDDGDAPDSYGTTLASNGARHLINYANYFLGRVVDSEAEANVYPRVED